MTPRNLIRFVVNFTIGSLMIVTAAEPCNAKAPEPAAAGTKLRLMGGRPVVDDVYLNGQGPFRFLIDTGAASNQFDAALARKLGLEASFQVELATAGGTTFVRGGRVGEVRLGAAKASNEEFLFTTLDGVHALSSSIEGVLGEEFLAKFDYLLDFRNRRVEFAAEGGTVPGGTAEGGAGTRAAFRMIEGLPAIQTSEGELAVDSGTDTTVLCRAGQGAAAQIRTASGFAEVATGSVRVRIGEREVRPAQTAFAPRAALAADGLLPASLFRSVFFSNSGHYLVLE